MTLAKDPWDDGRPEMKRFTATLDPECQSLLRKLARDRGVSLSAAVRACIRFAVPQLLRVEKARQAAA